MKRTSRPDINSISKQYGGATKNAGYEENLYVGSLPEGRHTVRIDQVDSKGKVIESWTSTTSTRMKLTRWCSLLCSGRWCSHED